MNSNLPKRPSAAEARTYDYLIVGAGLAGAVLAYRLHQRGYNVLVIDRRSHIAGNIYTKNIHGIEVHQYGAHIFHTSDSQVWDFVNSFAQFNHFINSPIAHYITNNPQNPNHTAVYNLPFNMNTFVQLWPDVVTPQDAKTRIATERQALLHQLHGQSPRNLEEQAISLVGRTIYEKLIKDYTEKQWGRPCTQLPPDIIKRLPVRFTFDNNYFNDIYQGIPIGGYTQLVAHMLNGITVKLNTDFFTYRSTLTALADHLIFTGKIDQFYNYCYGQLEYRSLNFQTKTYSVADFQGNAVINYTGIQPAYTRTIEHKHFEPNNPHHPKHQTIVTYEYPTAWHPTREAYYVINDDRNNHLAEQYRALATTESNVIFCGRLAEYKYYDMDQVIRRALDIKLP